MIRLVVLWLLIGCGCVSIKQDNFPKELKEGYTQKEPKHVS